MHFNLDHSIPKVVDLKGLDFYFKFEKGKLEIEQLHITKTTKAKWCNLIAMEHHQKIESIKTRSGHRSGYGGKFTWAALIFNDLISSEVDVQLLKDKKIVVDHLRMSNQELVEFFRKIASGVDHLVVDSSSYIQIIDDINNYSKTFLIKRMLKAVWNSFIYRKEWLLRFMNHDYNFVATVVAVSTIVQAVYAILAFYLRK
jgi:hypothetical protein